MCWERVAEAQHLALSLPNSEVVLIGSGAPNKLLDIRTETSFKGRIYSDYNCATYKAFGANYGILPTFTWKKWANYVGFLDFLRQGICKCRWPMYNAGDPWLQGGVCVLSLGDDGKPYCWLHDFESYPGYQPHNFQNILSITRMVGRLRQAERKAVEKMVRERFGVTTVSDTTTMVCKRPGKKRFLACLGHVADVEYKHITAILYSVCTFLILALASAFGEK